ncbi:MAG: GNAT family N-acetyltransferase [Candidatus Micrarchaeia archaeon]
MSEIKIEKVTTRDAAEISGLAQQLILHHVRFSKSYATVPNFGKIQLAHIRKQLRKSKNVAFKAVENGRIVGFALVEAKKHPPIYKKRYYAYVDSIMVSPGHRVKGVGSKLLDAAVAWARKRRSGEMQLTVDSKNAAAMHLYEKKGFREHRKIMKKLLRH